MEYSKKNRKSERKFHDTILDDLRRVDIRSSIGRDFRDMKRFYIDQERKRSLESMGRVRKFFWMVGFGFKSLYLKLNPARRILLLFAIFFFFMGVQGSAKFYESGDSKVNIRLHTQQLLPTLSFLTILFILMLELKDKLIARNELEAGRRVQTKLMPESNPKIEGWEVWLYTRPAHEVGGDMIDYMKLAPGKYYLAQGDVAGKGLGAALLMVKLQATLRAMAPDFHDPAALGEKMNDVFHRDTPPSEFASMVYLEIDENGSQVSVLNAGHMPPICIKNGIMSPLPGGNPALGLVHGVKFHTTGFSMNAGDIMVIYSDGLTEACNEYGDFFGEERLLGLIEKVKSRQANIIGEYIIETARRFTGDESSHDDLSLIVLRKE
ncbi:MAG: PP2C family protein-serine/threonine phosphatase [Candidatus Kapaibacterium sp.]